MAYKRGPSYQARWFDAAGNCHRTTHPTKEEAETHETLMRELRDLERAAVTVRRILPRKKKAAAAKITALIQELRA